MAQIVKKETKEGVSWMARVFVARDANGKRKYTARTFKTQAEAKAWSRKMENRKDEGVQVEPSRETVVEYLHRWLREVAASRVRTRTLDDYAGMVRRYVETTLPGAPAIGHLRLDRVTPQAIQSLYHHLHTDVGLSPRTVRYLHAVLRQAFQHAVGLGTLARNPTAGVKQPKMVRTEQTAMTKAEADRFLEAAKEDRLHALWVLLVTSGLRPGEALALRWDDLTGDRIQVRRTLVRRGAGGWKFEEPKTSKSRRTVVIPDVTVRALKTHRASQAGDRLQAGSEYEDNGLIFATGTGRPLDQTNLYAQNFRRILRAADLGTTEGGTFTPGFRMYDLRHTAATLLLQAGENVKVISERLGHSSVVITLDTYSHVLPDMQAGAAAKMQVLFG